MIAEGGNREPGDVNEKKGFTLPLLDSEDEFIRVSDSSEGAMW
jgi:hypothetical protein